MRMWTAVGDGKAHSTEACPECPQAFLELDHDGTRPVQHCPNCGYEKPARHCSICRTETTGAPLCDRCARHLRQECKLVHLAIAAGARVGSGTIRNLQRDEERLAKHDEWWEAKLAAWQKSWGDEEANDARSE